MAVNRVCNFVIYCYVIMLCNLLCCFCGSCDGLPSTVYKHSRIVLKYTRIRHVHFMHELALAPLSMASIHGKCLVHL